MKNHFKKYIIAIPIILLMICFAGCQQDDTILQENTIVEQDISAIDYSKLVAKESVPEVITTLRKSVGAIQLSAYTFDQVYKTIDTDRILKTKKDDGSIQYTFAFRAQNISNFDNLIISKNKEGIFQPLYVLNHRTSASYIAQYRAAPEQITSFDAVTTRHALATYFNSLSSAYVTTVSQTQYPEYDYSISGVVSKSDCSAPCDWEVTQNLCPLQPGTGTGVHTADECGSGIGTTFSLIVDCPELNNCNSGSSTEILAMEYYEANGGGGGSGSGGIPGDEGTLAPLDELLEIQAIVFLIESLDISLDNSIVHWLKRNMDIVTMVKLIQQTEPNTQTYKEIARGIINFAYDHNNAPASEDLLENIVEALGKDEITTDQANTIYQLVRENNNTEEAIKASNITLDILRANKLNGPYDQTYYQSINQYFEANTINPIFQTYFTTQCIITRLSFTPEEQEWCNKNPTLCDLKVYWLASKEMIQIGLDIGGVVPVIGEVCDITNGIIYTIDGDAVNASFSFGAAIPIAGWFATGAKMAYKTASNIASKQVLKWFVKTNGIITFGKSGQLKKVMGILPGSGTHAHHIIPFAKSENRLVQLAAKSGEAFHINDIINGVEVAAWRNTNHPTYSNRIVELMEEAWTPNMTPNQAYEALMDIVSDIKQVIQNNPNVKLNDLDF